MFSKSVNWYKNEGASEFQITELQSLVNFKLPETYIELLRYSNGGEASLSVQPFNFVLDSIQFCISYIKSEASNDFSEYFIFGGNGGGELLAIERNTGAVVSIDSCNSNTEEIIRIANTFIEFLSYVE